MHGIGDYIEYDYHGSDKHLANDTYADVLDTIVVACVDILVITSGSKVLLGRRARHPQKDWWLFGGRMRTGEHLTASASRLVRDELSLEIKDHARFRYLTTFAAAWKYRAHEPESNGTHTLSTVFALEITEDERSRLAHNEEYDLLLEYECNEVSNGRFHEAVKQCVAAYLG